MADTLIAELPRALAATVIVVVPDVRQDEALDAVAALRRSSGVRPLIISLGDAVEAPKRMHDGATIVEGIVPKYLNNAVASLRLSSLPALGWWRNQDLTPIRDFAALVDRLVLDIADPIDSWRMVPDLVNLAAVSDLRWTRLTRWRDLLAQFFDIPDVRQRFTSFDRLVIGGTDPHDTSLLAGWLKARLPGAASMRIEKRSGQHARLEFVELRAPSGRLSLRLLPNMSCVETTVEMPNQVSSRVVPLGSQRSVDLLTEELRIRARDLAFEQAAREAILR